ncbi:MAG: xanthine dehydrogenase FAD-binding subunit XdhB [Desulfobulbaceae bacterium]|nr:xanthine dehydrogenase FAD-binding subunit XdhB [Desulfobulbaceae bacterium]
MFDINSYHKASSVDEAIALLSQNPDAIPIAGGTDVLVRLHGHNSKYSHLVDIHDVAELKKVTMESDGTIVIGSGLTFTELAHNRVVSENIPVLNEGGSSVGGPQVRNVATVGGNICNGAPSGDSASPLLVLNATVELKGPDGVRQLPLHDFYQGPGQVDRKAGEIMTCLRIASEDYRGWSAHYYKYAMREAMDIATIGCGAACKIENGKIVGLRLGFAVAGPTPLRCRSTEEKAIGRQANEALLEMVKNSVLSDLRPRDSWRAAKDFREQIIKTLTERVLREALKRNTEME